MNKLTKIIHTKTWRVLSLAFMVLLVALTPLLAFAEDNVIKEIGTGTGSLTFGDQVINILHGTTGIMANVRTLFTGKNPLEPFALSLVALFFIIETLNKSVSFEKVTIEMVVKLLIRLLIAKILVSNASSILLRIDNIIITSTNNIMDSVRDAMTGIQNEFAAEGKSFSIVSVLKVFQDGDFRAVGLFSEVIMGVVDVIDTLGNGGMGSVMQLAGKVGLTTASKGIKVALSVAQVFFHGVSAGVNAASGGVIYFPAGSITTMWYVYLTILAYIIRIFVNITTWIQIYVTLMMRTLEMVLLAYLAPIAMAAFVSDEFKGQTKKFIISFATISLQAMVIVIICKLFDTLLMSPFDHSVMTTTGGNPVLGFTVDALVRLGFLDPWGSTWGFFQPLKLLFLDIIKPIVLGILIGKSRGIAQTLMGG